MVGSIASQVMGAYSSVPVRKTGCSPLEVQASADSNAWYVSELIDAPMMNHVCLLICLTAGSVHKAFSTRQASSAS